MKKLNILLLLILITSCEVGPPKVIKDDREFVGDIYYRIYIIEDCEYIAVGTDGFTHKGNCKFCEERRVQGR